jgi:hypothetical protein
MNNSSFLLTFLVSACIGFSVFLGYRVGYFMGSLPKKPLKRKRPIFRILKGGKNE